MKQKLTVLLVDDDKATNIFNKYKLKQLGLCQSITIATNGQEAIDFLKSKDEHGKNPQPDLIFLDINMPIMNGWEFLESYERLDNKEKGNVILIMLTTSEHEDDYNKAMENPNISGFRTKPLSTEMIQEIISEFWE